MTIPFLERFTGIQGLLFQLGLTGPQLKNNSGAVEARNNADAAFAIARAATPVGDDDLTTKRYVDLLNKPVVAAQQFDGNNALPAPTGTEQFYVVTTTGPNATIGQLLWDDGGAGTVLVVPALDGRSIFTFADFSGGTITLIGRSYYVWSVALSQWVLEASPELQNLIGTADNRPAANTVVSGVTYYATDQGITYQSDGTAWTIIANPGLVDQVFYVDSATGANTNVGTAAHPFLTLAQALTNVTPTPHGACEIHLVGAGPYTAPTQMAGVVPVGPLGKALMICGDSYTQTATGTVTAPPAGGTVTTDLAGGLNAYRGIFFRGLVGSSANRLTQIATNTAGPGAVLTSISGTFGAANADTFEIVQPQTVVTLPAGAKVSGAGLIGFWRIAFTSNSLTIGGSVGVLFDSCTAALGSVLLGQERSRVYMSAPSQAQGFTNITAVGTQSGTTGLYVSSGTVSFGISLSGGARLMGNLVSSLTVLFDSMSQGSFQGLDILSATTSITGVKASNNSYVEFNGSYCRIALGGATCNGYYATQNATIVIGSGCTVTGCGTAALRADLDGFISASAVAGSTNNGVGMLIQAGIIQNLNCTVTNNATGGDVQFDQFTAVTYAIANANGSVNATLRSSLSLSGTQLVFIGGLTTTAGNAVVFFGQGGLPGVANNSATAIRIPVTPGRTFRAFRITPLTNIIANAGQIFVVFKAPLATGTPGSTAITITVGATSTASLSDTTHTVSFNDGDQIDLRASCNNAGLAGQTSTFTASLSGA